MQAAKQYLRVVADARKRNSVAKDLSSGDWVTEHNNGNNHVHHVFGLASYARGDRIGDLGDTSPVQSSQPANQQTNKQTNKQASQQNKKTHTKRTTHTQQTSKRTHANA